MPYTLKINGSSKTVNVEPDTPLLWVLRNTLHMKGTKFGCGMAMCGACTVHLDGVATRSCITPVSTVGRQAVTTIEGVAAANPVGAKVQTAWLDADVPQCGYCQAGQIMTATALLTDVAKPTDAQIDSAMRGNICRCGTYNRIRAAIKTVARIQVQVEEQL